MEADRPVPDDSVEYQSPRITDYGDFPEQTKHDRHGDPLNSHGHDPHLAGSV